VSHPLPTYDRENLRAHFKGDTCESRRTTLSFYAELFVEHSPAAVWSFFTDLGRWSEWSPICRGCRLRGNGDELTLGSVLEISFAVMGITLTVPSTVVEFDPPGTIAWRGEKFGIQALHSYRFVSHAGGTLLCNAETFTGTNPLSRRLMSAWYRKSKLSRQSLEGIRRELRHGRME
jgi:ligand-binding SRPBCC domain-containing protein